MSSEFLPEDVELSTESDILSDFIYLCDASSVDDDLSVFGLVRGDDACENVDEGCFACSIVA
jgi:hypothetical protein